MVRVNGTMLDIAGQTVSDYLSRTEYNLSRVAIEINGEIVPKSKYSETLFHDDDNVEIVSFVGGG